MKFYSFKCISNRFLFFQIIIIFLFIIHPSIYAQYTLYSSANPYENPNDSPENLLHISLDDIFNLGPKASDGIKGNAGSGEVILSVYYYKDKKYGLLYRSYSSENSTSKYVNKSYDYPYDNYKTFWDAKLPSVNIPSIWKSNNIKSMLLKSSSLIIGGNSTDAFFSMLYWSPRVLPVVVELLVKDIDDINSLSVKVPGISDPIALSTLNKCGSRFMLNNGRVMVCSHRGYWENITNPENTINSIKASIDKGFKMIELDIDITADDSTIVLHDMGLNKRTIKTGAVSKHYYSANSNNKYDFTISDLYVKNGFGEVVESSTTKIITLREALKYIKESSNDILVNLDRAANDMSTFKKVYPIVKATGMLKRTIFKGRYTADPASSATMPTVSNLKAAINEIYHNSLTALEITQKLKEIMFTPVLFDNKYDSEINTNDDTYATNLKVYIDEFINNGAASGFELTYKAYPQGQNNGKYEISNNKNIVLLRSWDVLNNKTFVKYIHDKGYPVGIFASTPEVCAIPGYNKDTGTRDMTNLVSGFLKEYYDVNTMDGSFNPYVKEQADYDFRGDWDFYITAGADYVITDRPDALSDYLSALSRLEK